MYIFLSILYTRQYGAMLPTKFQLQGVVTSGAGKRQYFLFPLHNVCQREQCT